MTYLVLALVALAQAPPANRLGHEVLAEGLAVDGVTVKLTAPTLREGMSEADRMAAVKGAVDLPLDEFLRDSINAPFKLKVRDVPYPSGVVRVVDLWFAIHADLDEVDLDALAGQKDQARTEEVANMAFSGRTLTDLELKARSIEPGPGLDRYLMGKGTLLDRVEVATVNHVVATKGEGAVVIASKTDRAFDKDPEFANRWLPLPGPGEAKKDLGPPRVYQGSVAYTRVGRLSDNKPSILLVESHVAFAEPKAWFNGTSILRAKFNLIAQDQLRKLRREVATRRKKAASTPKA